MTISRISISRSGRKGAGGTFRTLLLGALVASFIALTPTHAFAFGSTDTAWNNYYSSPSDSSTWGSFCAGGGGGVVANADGVPACGPTGSTPIEIPGGISTPGFQCVELSERFLYISHGWTTLRANGAQVAKDYSSAHSVPLVSNGTVGVAPHVGDVMSFSTTSNFSDTGHTGVVTASSVNASGNGSINLLSENVSGTGNLSSFQVNGWRVASVFGFTYSEWIQSGGGPSGSASITGVTPTSGPVGTAVTITGTNLSGATQLSFNGTKTSIAGNTATQISTVVPGGATTGNIAITTPSGIATYPFTVVQLPSWSLAGITGNEEVYTIDSGGKAWEKFFSPGTGTWSSWVDLGAPPSTTLVGRPWVWISPVTNNEEIFAHDSAGNYWQDYYSSGSGTWSSWYELGSPGTALSADPTVVQGISGNEEVYGIDSAGKTWEKFFSPGTGTWSSWFDLGAPPSTTLVGRPWVWISPVTNNEEIFARDSAGNYWQDYYSSGSGTWSSWYELGSPGTALSADPTVVQGISGNEEVYGIDSAGKTWETFFSPGTGIWSSWFDLGAPPSTTLVGRPWVWISPVTNNEEIFARDSAGNYWQDYYSSGSGTWSNWYELGSPGTALSADPTVVQGISGNEEVYGIDSAGKTWEKFPPRARGPGRAGSIWAHHP